MLAEPLVAKAQQAGGLLRIGVLAQDLHYLIASPGVYLTDGGEGDAMGPLVVSADNPNYFAKPDGTIVVLQGSHTWNSSQDLGPGPPPPVYRT
jgi:hypothetical protein